MEPSPLSPTDQFRCERNHDREGPAFAEHAGSASETSMALSDTLFELCEEMEARIREIETYIDPSCAFPYSEQVRAECGSLLTIMTDARVLADRSRLLPGLDLPP
jgi:hypothetical protein